MCINAVWALSALGHKRTFHSVLLMSALPLKASQLDRNSQAFNQRYTR